MKPKVLGNIYCSYLELENNHCNHCNHHDYDYIGRVIDYDYDYFA